MADYEAWLESAGVRFQSAVAIADLPAPYYRGLVAKEDVPANKAVFSIPQSLLLTIYTMNDVSYPLAPVLGLSKELELREDDILAITLIYEKVVRVCVHARVCGRGAVVVVAAGVSAPCYLVGDVSAGRGIDVVAAPAFVTCQDEQRVLFQRCRA